MAAAGDHVQLHLRVLTAEPPDICRRDDRVGVPVHDQHGRIGLSRGIEDAVPRKALVEAIGKEEWPRGIGRALAGSLLLKLLCRHAK